MTFDAATFSNLMQSYRFAHTAPLPRQWQWLEALHIVGQSHLVAHWKSHCLMFQLAWRCHDTVEMVGQIFRLVLVPFGHLANRLPHGNSGRSHVSAFKSMPIDTVVAALIESARSAQANASLHTR
jgi:Protein of unknown function (DUF3703)